MTFTIKPHSVTGQDMVEIVSDDGQLLAALYQTGTGVQFISKHIRPGAIIVDSRFPPRVEIILPV